MWWEMGKARTSTLCLPQHLGSFRNPEKCCLLSVKIPKEALPCQADGMHVLSCNSFKIHVEITPSSPPNSPNCQEALRATEILPDVSHVCGLSPGLSCEPHSDAYRQKKVHSTRKVHTTEGSLRRVSCATLSSPCPSCSLPRDAGSGVSQQQEPKEEQLPRVTEEETFCQCLGTTCSSKVLNNR